MAAERPDLKRYVGRKLTVIAWLWARTVRSPNPAFADVEVPLASTFILSKKKRKGSLCRAGDRGRRVSIYSQSREAAGGGCEGHKLLEKGRPFCVWCRASQSPMTYIRSEGQAGRMGARLMAIVAEGDRGRVYLGATHLGA